MLFWSHSVLAVFVSYTLQIERPSNSRVQVLLPTTISDTKLHFKLFGPPFEKCSSVYLDTRADTVLTACYIQNRTLLMPPTHLCLHCGGESN